MFDRSASATSRSTQPLVLSLAIHAAAVLVLLTAHFAVEVGVTPVRNSRVRLVAPSARVPVGRLSIRTPHKAPTVPIRAAFSRLSLPALAPPAVQPQPVFEAPPV